MSALTELWVYLSRDPLAALTATLLAWLAATWCARRARWHPAANPVLIAVLLLVTYVPATSLALVEYFYR